MASHAKNAARLRYVILASIALFALCQGAAAPCFANGCVVVPSRHAWGAFQPGSWKKVQVVSKVVDESGKTISTRTTITKSTLVEVDAEGYTLEVESTVMVADREITSSPRFVRCSFTGEGAGQQTFENLAPATVKIGEREFPSRVQRIISTSGSTRRISTVHYNQDVAPFVLKRQTVAVDSKTAATLDETVVEVLSTAATRTVALEHNPRAEVKTVAQVKTVHTTSAGRTETVEWYSADIPGAVVAHETQKFSADGRLLAQSRMELLDYEISDGEERPSRPRILRFRRWKRLR
jgi:hypothetical protein